MKELTVRTSKHEDFIDITSQVQKTVTDSGVTDGVCFLYTPHTTAGITINENADPDVMRDVKMALDTIVSDRWDYRHGEGNSPAHVKSSLVGPSLNIFVQGGRLAFGTWQGIYFCEFDGPRTRRLWVKVIEQ